MISPDTLERIVLLTLAKTGIKIRAEDRAKLSQKLSQRIKALALKNDREYLDILSQNCDKHKSEWDRLISFITTGESYFFRDRGQINLLKHHLLPDAIQKNKDSTTLNILSAGCSTGEEVYSLAIILGELIPNLDNWNINLVGVDINIEAISKARKGIYPQWSFRGVENHYRSVYFRHKLEGWEIIESVKKRVKFYQCNLVADEISFFPIGSVDLIICRNVFIYFDRDKIATVLTKFIELLRPGGRLITGHTELQEQEITPLQVLTFSESLVYEMPSSKSSEIALKDDLFVITPNSKELGKQSFEEGKYQETIGYLQDWLNLNPQDQEALILIAQSYANQANYEKAIKLCHHILEIDSSSLAALGILAQIAEEQDRLEDAKEYLRRITFIDPNYVTAYLDLIDLHIRDQEYQIAGTLLFTLKTITNNAPNQYEHRIKAIENFMAQLT